MLSDVEELLLLLFVHVEKVARTVEPVVFQVWNYLRLVVDYVAVLDMH